MRCNNKAKTTQRILLCKVLCDEKRKIILIVLTLILSTCLSFALVGRDKTAKCVREWENIDVRVELTCIAVESQEQKCAKCQVTQTIEISPLNHDYEGTEEEWDKIGVYQNRNAYFKGKYTVIYEAKPKDLNV